MVKSNKDLLYLVVACLAILVTGFFLATILLGMTGKEVVISMFNFVAFLVSFFIAIMAFVMKLYSKQGMMSKRLIDTQLIEKVRQNLDIWFFVTCLVLVSATGYFFARFYLNLNMSEIKSSITEFFEFLFTLIVAINTFVVTLSAKQGTMAESLSKQVDKQEFDIDGRSII